MTLQLAHVGQEPTPARFESAWPVYLGEALLAGWRPGEWDPVTLKFTGNPDNTLTGVSVCATKACSSIVDGPTIGRCLACRKRRATWTDADGDFDVDYTPRLRYSGDLAYTFRLAGLSPIARDEVLYGLQQREAEGLGLRPTAVAGAVRMVGDADSVLDISPEGSALHVGYLRAIQTHVRRLRAAHAGRDGTEGEVWDCALVGLHSARDRRYRAASGHLDFTVIRQSWLRRLVLEWARALRPAVADARQMLHAAEIAGFALMGRPHGDDATRLGMADMTTVVDALAAAQKPATGTLYSLSHRHGLISRWRRLIQFGRSSGLLDSVPGTFALPSDRRLPAVRKQEGELGRAIPEAWIAHLDNHLESLGSTTSFANNEWTRNDYAAQYRTIYELIRDTGRRPTEILSLARNPIEFHGSDASLIYDNRKAGRLGRRLPIDPSTVTILQAWSDRLESLPVPTECAAYLFPTPGARNRERRGHMRASQFGKVFRAWVLSLADPPELPALAMRFRRDDIEPYGLRHAYAQRHADNGTDIDVLRELMDHIDVTTTMGYYNVSLKRKQDAVRLLSKYTIDRHGAPAPFPSALAYQRSSVAVPFGNCTEPKNVQAGGKSCPIRFQCAGCGYFRPDPSYLAALENHVTQLRVDKELALAADAADWVVRNLDEQLSALGDIATSMRTMIESLAPADQVAIEAASATVRRSRGATAFIPLTSIGMRPND